jgi:hypothetical protein
LFAFTQAHEDDEPFLLQLILKINLIGASNDPISDDLCDPARDSTASGCSEYCRRKSPAGGRRWAVQLP